MHHSVKAIIFDMDGVLCDSEQFIADVAIRMFLETYQVSVHRDDFLPFVGTGEDRYLGGVAQKHGIHLSLPRDKNRTYEIYLQEIRGRLKPLPGAVQFVADCRRKGFKLALATSADRIKADGNLREIGIPIDRFDAVVTGDQISRKKPDPQVFQFAAERLQQAPSNCLVIEDAINGVHAAKAAGCRCLGITSSFNAIALRDAGADFIAPDLAYVPPEAII
ncbi:MAG TPA: HAD-IA family hydrolase [Tepidisphaeraceae bacterium]|nr:HAD-IA family hydrolase [Tepidisphaeraceae bacterium]